MRIICMKLITWTAASGGPFTVQYIHSDIRMISYREIQIKQRHSPYSNGSTVWHTIIIYCPNASMNDTSMDVQNSCDSIEQMTDVCFRFRLPIPVEVVQNAEFRYIDFLDIQCLCVSVHIGIAFNGIAMIPTKPRLSLSSNQWTIRINHRYCNIDISLPLLFGNLIICAFSSNNAAKQQAELQNRSI